MRITSSQLRRIIKEELSRHMEGGYDHRGIGYMEEEDDTGLLGAMKEEDEGDYGQFEEEDEMGMYEEDEGDYLEEEHDNDQKRMNQPGGDEAHYLKQRIKAELSERLRRR
jgi:hypothetical protein